MVKNTPADAGDVRDAGLISGQKDLLEKDTKTHFSILAWRIPWTEEPSRLHSPCSRKGRTQLSDQTTTTTYICVNVGYLFFSF